MSKSKVSLLLEEISVDQLKRALKKKGTLLRICAQNGLASAGNFPKNDEALKKLVIDAWEKHHGPMDEAGSASEEPQPPKKAKLAAVEDVVEEDTVEEVVEEPKPKKRKRTKKAKVEEVEETPAEEGSDYWGKIEEAINNLNERMLNLERVAVDLQTKMDASVIAAEALIKQAQNLEKFTERMMDIAGPELFGDIFDDDGDGDGDDDDASDGGVADEDDDDGYE